MSVVIPSLRGAIAVPSWAKNELWRRARAVPSLDLRFADNKSLVDATTGAQLVTFTRASSGTFVGSDGVLQRAVTNLLLRSEEFDQSPWASGASGNATVTSNAIPSPFGPTTADLLDDTSTTQIQARSQAINIVSSTRSYTLSAFIHPGTSSVVSLRLGLGGATGINAEVVANLATGVGQWRSGANVGTSFAVTPIGGNWYRVSVTVTDNGTGNNAATIELRPAFALTYADTLDVTAQGSAYFWGAQLEQSTTVGEYIPTTSTINSAPRFDHNPTTGESLGLLVEEQRTNGIRNNTMVGAVAGTPGTVPTNWLISTATGNLTSREIVGTGTENGISYIDVRFVTSGSFTASIYADSSTGVAASNGQTWTSSFYVKLAAGSLTNVTVQLSVVENDSGGNFLAGADSSAFVPTSAALITQRQTQTRTNTNASTAFEWSRVRVNFSGAGDITLRIGLPQLELGAFATSVIPTTTASATRSADVASISGSNFSSWYRQDEGTVFTSFNSPVPTSVSVAAAISNFDDGTANNRFSPCFYVSSAGQVNANQLTSGVSNYQLFGAAGVDLKNTQKAATALSFGDYGMSVNGLAPVTDSSAVAVPTVNTLRFGTRPGGLQANGHIRRLTYWPARLSNASLQTITQ